MGHYMNSAMNQYRQTGIAAATVETDPVKLIAMLLGGAIDRLAYARGAMLRKEREAKHHYLSSAMSIIEHLRTIQDKNPYLRGLIAGLGHRQIGIAYDRAPRTAGSTKFNFMRLMRLGIDGVVSQSTAPLHYITLFGFALCGLSGIVSVAYIIYWAMNWQSIAAGFTTMVLLQLLTIGLNAAFLGVLGEYLARVTENVRGHPFVVIERTINDGVESMKNRVFEIGEARE